MSSSIPPSDTSISARQSSSSSRVSSRSLGSGRSSAVSHGVEGRADLLAATDTELAESSCENGFRHGSEIVEGGDTVVIDSFIGSHRDTRGDCPDGAGHGGDDDVVEYGDDFIARNDEHGTSLLVGCFDEPELGLGYQGSASVIAMALAIARSSSSGVWGCSR